MKGLFLKDLYMIWKYCRMLLLLVVCFTIGGAAVGSNMQLFFILYPVIVGAILPVTLISYDERFHWDRTCGTLPLKRSTIVTEKYLLTLCLACGLILLSLAVQAAVLLPRGRLADFLSLIPMELAVGLLTPSLMLPVIFRLGVEKGRLAYFVAVGVVVAVGVGVGRELDPAAPVSVPLALPIAGSFLLFGLSWLLSIRLYEKREL